MTVTLVTVSNVPILSTGTYQLASGETTFSQEDLADAVLAAQDPTVPPPRIKLGHNDARFDEAVASGELDGEPAFGTVENLRLSDDGQTVFGDYVDVPEWLAESIQSAYPGRSIEGGFAYTAPSGRQYRLVIARVALLGVTWPGVTSLADLREVLEQNGGVDTPTEVAAGVERLVMARISRPRDEVATAGHPSVREVLAGLDLGSVRMQFCGDLDDGEVPQVPDSQPGSDDCGPQMWWWPRSVRVEDDGSLCLIVDDDEGHLIRIPFTVQQGDLVYGDPELVIEQYVPVTSDPDDVQAGGQTLGAWPVRAATRPTKPKEPETMDIDAAALRKRLGLAEDADEQAIQAALEAEPEPKPDGSDGEGDGTPAAPQVPDGMALIDQETLSELRNGAEQGVAVAARLRLEDRDKTIRAAVQQGKIPVSRREHYEKLWDRDEEGTRTLLTAKVEDGGLAAGAVPVGPELGGAGDGEGQTAETDAAYQQFFASHFPNEHNRLRGGNGRTRIRQEA